MSDADKLQGETEREYLFRLYPDLLPIEKWLRSKQTKRCPTCGGSGRERLVTGETNIGNVVIRQVDSVKCSTCGGSREVNP